ncbi:MAG: hypothetical protein PHP32_07615 [Candidatus Izemoplasmatales bacterium]|nr:hypothetical protein [Candidatus Izemoplasmatales bacterium]
MSPFEIAMLLCFGMAWPASIYKSYTSRSSKGKSVQFLYIVLIGYVAGILHKIFYSYDFVIILYGINAAMVFTDLMLYYRNKRIEAKQINA